MDTFRNQFIKDLAYFNYGEKLKKVNNIEYLTKNINSYNIDEIYDNDNYLQPNKYQSGRLTNKDGWLDMSGYNGKSQLTPCYDDSFEEIFEEDEDKYVMYLFLWVVKLNSTSKWSIGVPYEIYIKEPVGDEGDEKIVDIDFNVLKEIFDNVQKYYHKSRSANNKKEKGVKDKNINISELMENYDEVYDHIYPKIKRFPRPINNDQIEINKKYENRKVHKSQNRRQLIRYFNGEDKIVNEKFIKLFAYTLRQ